MFNKLYNKTHKTLIPRPSQTSKPSSSPSKQPPTPPNPTCPDCCSNLELPPSLDTLQRSEKAQYITINTSLDRTIPLCKRCARTIAQTTAATMAFPESQEPIQASILSRLQQANDLIYNPDLPEATKAQLRLAKPKLEEMLRESKKEERELKEYWELRGQMTKTVDLIGQGVYVEDLGRVLEIMLERSDGFQRGWERKGWMGYWGVWGWGGEMRLDS